MDKRELAAHESLDLHEIINFKTLCVAKSKLMQGLVFDQDLKTLMEKMFSRPLKIWLICRRFMNVHLFRLLFLKTGRHRSSTERKVSTIES